VSVEALSSDELENEKVGINEEIRNYPTQIGLRSAVQFPA